MRGRSPHRGDPRLVEGDRFTAIVAGPRLRACGRGGEVTPRFHETVSSFFSLPLSGRGGIFSMAEPRPRYPTRRFALPPPRMGRKIRAAFSISARGEFLVYCNGLLEVVVFLARNEAEIFQFREHLVGLGGFAEHQVGLAKMLTGAAVARIERQRLLVMTHGRLQLTQPSI